ncbi:MAG: GvpL/GvpF family gas vesicle protein [Planctomycetota bacterium]
MKSSLYVYAFCDQPLEGAPLVGLDNADVFFLEGGGMCAAVSRAPSGRLRPQRRLLAAHQRVLSSIVERVSVLPAAFGLVADDRGSLLEAMSLHAGTLRQELERIDGCVELEIRLAWTASNVFEHLVEIDEMLRALRDELLQYGASAPHDLKVAVGRRVDAVLAHYRSDAETRLMQGIEPVCREVQGHAPGAEGELARIAALVERESLNAFDAALESAASTFDESHVFNIAGPFAPHSFVDLRLDLSSVAA